MVIMRKKEEIMEHYKDCIRKGFNDSQKLLFLEVLLDIRDALKPKKKIIK